MRYIAACTFAAAYFCQRPTLHRTWTYIRRLVASIMLVAFASSVLHGSAMARLTPMHAVSGAAVHQHDLGAHDHGVSTEYWAADHQIDAASDAADHHGAAGACCGSFCATAIAPFAREAAVSRLETSADLPSYEADGDGIADEGPRKPPRTPDIA